METGLPVVSVYTDFSKAFDRVSYILLIAKIVTMGLDGLILSWLNSFLVGRTQAVPQEFHCGPILFNVFVCDIGRYIADCPFMSFTDDLKMIRRVNSWDDALFLQEDISHFLEWCEINQMNLNKGYKITCSRLKEAIVFPYNLI